ncbi:hypothetical protein D3C76_602150 [compost metagenome]
MTWPPIARTGSANGYKPSPSERRLSSPLVAAGQCGHPADPAVVPRAARGPAVAGGHLVSPHPAGRSLSAPCAGLQPGAGPALHPAEPGACHPGGPCPGAAPLPRPSPAAQAVRPLPGAARHHRHLRHGRGARSPGLVATAAARPGAGSRQLPVRPVRHTAGPCVLQHAVGGAPHTAEHRERPRDLLAPRQPARHALIPHLPAAGVAAHPRHTAGARQPHLHALLHQLHHSAGAGRRPQVHHPGSGRLSGTAL